MRSVYEGKLAQASEIERKLLQGTARICSGKFGRVCKALWPFKTAEELAARTGRSVRACAYEISGECEVSSRSLMVVINEIVS
jgi:hypothetical protein